MRRIQLPARQGSEAMKNFLDLSLREVSDLLKNKGQPEFRAKQVFKGYCEKLNFHSITNVPKSLREELEAEFCDCPIAVERELVSSDETRKYLYRLCDGNVIEGVLMKYKHGNTLCVSTQVGCAMGCVFCASTKGGLVRNLSSGEILGQVALVNKLLGGTASERRITNVVLMGSGEPLENYDNTVDFIKNVSDSNGLGISVRNVSVSTCGLPHRIRDLADTALGVTLTVSLHASSQSSRAEIMPIARKYSIEEVVSAAKYYFSKTGRRVIFEYTAIAEKNVSDRAAIELSELVGGFPCHVNVILLNPIKESDLRAPSKKQAYAFIEKLSKRGVSATLRRQMGADIEGACGQLRNEFVRQDVVSIGKKD